MASSIVVCRWTGGKQVAFGFDTVVRISEVDKPDCCAVTQVGILQAMSLALPFQQAVDAWERYKQGGEDRAQAPTRDNIEKATSPAASPDNEVVMVIAAEEDVEVVSAKEDRRRFAAFFENDTGCFVNTADQMHDYIWRSFHAKDMELWVDQAVPGDTHVRWDWAPRHFMACVNEEVEVDAVFVAQVMRHCNALRKLCNGD